MKSLSRSLRSGLLAVLASGLAMANTATFVTPAGSTTGGGAVSAQAVITTGVGSVIVDLTNLLTAAQVVDVAQNLSDLAFTLSGGTFGSVSNTNRVYTGKLVDVAGSGAVTTDGGNGNPAAYNGWDFSNTGSNFLLEDLGSVAGPAHTILGGTTSTATYTNANGSIAGNGPHNPFLQGPVHFVLTISGVTAATNITSATFSFGTTLGVNIPSSPVPEPRFVSFLLIGAMLSAAAYYRKKRSVQ